MRQREPIKSDLLRTAQEFKKHIGMMLDWEATEFQAYGIFVADRTTDELYVVLEGEKLLAEQCLFKLVKHLPQEVRHRLTMALAEKMTNELGIEAAVKASTSEQRAN